MPLEATGQADWGGGIYRGRKAPDNTVYDAVNALIDDEGLIYRRGGSAYYSASNAGENLLRAWSLHMRAPAANRVVMQGATGVHVLNSALAPVRLVSLSAPLGRHASIGGFAASPFHIGVANAVAYYGGSLKAAYQTGTTTVTNGSATVTGSGTAWLANVDPGMIVTDAYRHLGIVKSVVSNTQITLTAPWSGATQTAGLAWQPMVNYAFDEIQVDSETTYATSAGAGTPRLLVAGGNRVYFTSPGNPVDFAADHYHEVPANVNIIGAEGRGDSALIFTTGGVYEIGNLTLDPVDDFGNIQHTVELLNKDVVLWDDFGIAGFAGGLIVPCVDDVFLMAPDGSLAPLTERIRPLYRDYVKAGYQPGQATVHRGHYFLPILNGTTWVDTLVCRLDRGAAWTRWGGHAGGSAYVTVSGDAVRQPNLLGIKGVRVTDLTDCFDPTSANASDADGAVRSMTVVTRDYPTSASNHPGTVARARLRYELADDGNGATAAPTVAVAFSSDQDGGVFTALPAGPVEASTATAGGVSDGSSYQAWPVGKRRERIRFRISQTGAAASFVLRTLELLVRQSGLR